MSLSKESKDGSTEVQQNLTPFLLKTYICRQYSKYR